MVTERRGLFDFIFGRRRTEDVGLRLTLIGYGSVFSEWPGNPYQADVVRSAVDAIARNAAKLKPRHIRRVEGKILPPANAQIERLLQVRPNPNMSTYDMLYKVVTTLMIENNAFIYPQRDADGNLIAIWPISCSRAEFFEDKSGAIYVRFIMRDNRLRVVPYSELIHLRRHFHKSDVGGEDNSPINATLNAITVTNEGLAQAVKSSASLRGLLKFMGMLKDEDIARQRDRFVKEYLDVSKSGGIAALDSKAEYIELKNDPKIINAPQMKELRDAVYRYFGVSESIVQSKYTEDEWNAFYESVIEPLAVQLSLEFTAKLFSERERGFGNEIIFESNRLQYASVNSKIALVEKLIDRGLLTLNEAREVFNLGPVDGGDKRLVSLNLVSAQYQDLYQLGKGEDNAGDTQA